MTWKTTNFNKMLVRMKLANEKSIKIGVTDYKPHKRSGKPTKSMAQVYQWMEEGTSDGVVPKRPTLKPTFEKNRPLRQIFANNMMHGVVSGNYKKHMKGLGIAYTKLVKDSITTLSNPPLTPFTIINRVNSGTTNPLIDTGQLLNSISYKIT